MEFSVVVPTYKRTKKLRKCLEALVGQSRHIRHPEPRAQSRGEGSPHNRKGVLLPPHSQMWRDQNDEMLKYEVIVIEDSNEGSSGVEELVKEFGGIYLSQSHKGPAAARNKGIKKARGRYIAFTDDDCVVPRDWLVRLKEGFEKYQDVAGIGGYMEAPAKILEGNVFAQYESYMTRKVYGAGDEEIVGGFEVPTGGTNNIAYRKDVLEEVGGFDETFPTAAGEDADLKKRICDKGYKIAYLPLKVEHHHGFFTSLFPENLFQFCAQSWRRGIGSAYFHKKHDGGLGRGKLVLNLVLLPFRFVKELVFGRELSRSVACVKYVAIFFDTLAQLTS